MTVNSRIWLARALIGAVLIINVQSALVFFINPSRFAPAYELTGIPGQAAMRGFAVLFLMWNVPYLVALINPIKYRISLYEAIAMQCIGLAGESIILRSLPIEYNILRDSITRFIIFDGAGLVALISAAGMTKSIRANIKDH
jgi:hypothetical protein